MTRESINKLTTQSAHFTISNTTDTLQRIQLFPSTALRHHVMPTSDSHRHTATLIHYIHELQRRTNATFPAATPTPFPRFDHEMQSGQDSSDLMMHQSDLCRV
ncbi:hypothetical protein NX059_005811 [Plenodomus lindquistii]|nr:hypothetical protein NX059_005811 [Plenodomus lindquistii]